MGRGSAADRSQTRDYVRLLGNLALGHTLGQCSGSEQTLSSNKHTNTNFLGTHL